MRGIFYDNNIYTTTKWNKMQLARELARELTRELARENRSCPIAATPVCQLWYDDRFIFILYTMRMFHCMSINFGWAPRKKRLSTVLYNFSNRNGSVNLYTVADQSTPYSYETNEIIRGATNTATRKTKTIQDSHTRIHTDRCTYKQTNSFFFQFYIFLCGNCFMNDRWNRIEALCASVNFHSCRLDNVHVHVYNIVHCICAHIPYTKENTIGRG